MLERKLAAGFAVLLEQLSGSRKQSSSYIRYITWLPWCLPVAYDRNSNKPCFVPKERTTKLWPPNDEHGSQGYSFWTMVLPDPLGSIDCFAFLISHLQIDPALDISGNLGDPASIMPQAFSNTDVYIQHALLAYLAVWPS